MPQRDYEAEYESIRRDIRQRVRDQVGLIRAANKDEVAWDTRAVADFNYLFVPEVVLVATKDRPRLERALRRRDDVFLSADDETGIIDRPIPGLVRYRLPIVRETGERSVRSALDIIDQELGEKGVVTPDHYLHVSAMPGNGRPCPATEPEETGLSHPWPRRTAEPKAGKGVTVTVVDTGWWPQAARHAWLASNVYGEREQIGAELHEYSGHGTFIAGVVRCRAPKAKVRHERFAVRGGAVRESAMVTQLRQALERHRGNPRPHVINLSAGTHTRDQQVLKSFQVLWDGLSQPQLSNTVLVAAAGNDGSSDPFFPAAFDWAVGVGSLDRRGGVSSFSNYGASANIYVVGRNHVNAYPDGHYVCKETPDKGDERNFTTGLARWSGTSFAAPLVTGLIAAAISADKNSANPTGRSSSQIAWDLVNGVPELPVGTYGKIRRVPQPYA